ncbi:MAG: hypothetical protein ACOZFS_04520 [Thermodesulfobacteriota bacterium]
MSDIIQAIHDPHLFRPLFRDLETWASWQTFLKAAFGLSMNDQAELDLFRQCTKRQTPPATPAKEVDCIVGRRGGKSRIISVIAVYLAAFVDYSQVLAPGEMGVVAILAVDREQSRIILSYCREAFRFSPILAQMVSDDLAYEIRLKNQTAIRVMTSGTASVRGYTLVAAICEEAAFWRVEGRDPGHEIVRSLRPGLATTGGPMFKISSPYSKAGFLWESYQKHYGQEGPVLVWQAPTRVMNPSIPQELIDRALADDRVAAECEYLAMFRHDISGLFDGETIDSVVIPGRRELPPRPDERYCAFADPSGGRQDAFTLALAHKDMQTGFIVLDMLKRSVPPFNPAKVVGEFAGALREYRVYEVVGDRYSAEWVVSAFRENGITYIASDKDRSQIFQEALPLFTRGQVELLDDKVLLSELRGLERRTRPMGRDMITHGPGGNDDLANSACGAMVLAVGKDMGPVEYESVARRKYTSELWGGDPTRMTNRPDHRDDLPSRWRRWDSF